MAIRDELEALNALWLEAFRRRCPDSIQLRLVSALIRTFRELAHDGEF